MVYTSKEKAPCFYFKPFPTAVSQGPTAVSQGPKTFSSAVSQGQK